MLEPGNLYLMLFAWKQPSRVNPQFENAKTLADYFPETHLDLGDELQREAEGYPIPGLEQPNDSSKEDHPLYV
jgi:hypothetical protein